MALVTPIGVSIPAFDASREQVFQFIVQGGDQVVGNKLTIVDNATGTKVYESTIQSYEYRQLLPANTLENNKYYAFYFNTINVNGEMSWKSSNVTFRTFTQPTLTFTNIPTKNLIESGNYTFICEYNQVEGEPISKLFFHLYDATHTEIQTSDGYTTSLLPPVLFTHEFTGLVDDERYYVRAIGTTVYGTTVDSGYVLIDVNYSYDGAYFAVTAINNAVGGYVQVSNNISEIDGQVWDKEDYPTDPIFEDSNSLVLDNGDHLIWSEGFSFANNKFSAQKWWTPIWFGQTTKFSNYSILEGHEGDGNSYITIELKRGLVEGETQASDYLVAKGYIDGQHYFTKVSNFNVPLNNLSQVTSALWIVNDQMDLVLSRTSGGHTIIWNGTSDVQYGVFTNITWLDEGAGDSTNLSDGDTNYITFEGESNVEYNKITDLFWEDEQQAPYIQEVDEIHYPYPVRYITNVRLDNAVVRDFYVTHDVSQPSYLSEMPPWDKYTIMRATFDNNLRAGNVDWLLNAVNKVKIKRRLVGTTQYITLYEQKITTEYDLTFYYRDYYCPSGYQFEYAMVPVKTNDEGGEEEQGYYTTVTKTFFDGLFVCDKDKCMKLYSNYLVNSSMDNILLGQVQPYNQVYPVIIKNPYVQYRTIQIQGDVLGLSDNKNCSIFELNNDTRPVIVDEKREWDKFLCDGKAKIIKDWNGNILMGRVTTPPSYTYDQTSGNGKPTLTFGMTEQGEYDNQSHMYKNGLIDVPLT